MSIKRKHSIVKIDVKRDNSILLEKKWRIGGG